MESKVQYSNSPPSYNTPASTQYPTTGAAYPAPAPGTAPYPPQQYPPATGQAPYGQPSAGYPPHVASAPQQQQVLYVSAGQQEPVIVQQVQSYSGYIVFACIVFWCCNWLFGLIAFILAMVASSTAVSDPAGARKLGHASLGMSIAGIVVSVIIIIIVYAVINSRVDSCEYTIYGRCYAYRTSYNGYCSGVRSGSYCYYN